ncbi:MAG: LTA synthase family protein [Bacteroidales bacterium]
MNVFRINYNMHISRGVKLVAKTYLLVLLIFTIFRVILFITALGHVNLSATSNGTIIQAFIMGLRFDIVVSGYVMLLPAVVLFVFDILNKDNALVRKLLFIWISVFFTLFFMVSAADIPYFNNFYERFSVGAFQWIDNYEFMVSMIVHEPKFILIIIPFLLLLIPFYLVLRKIFQTPLSSKPTKLWIRISLSFVALFLVLVGIRGRMQQKSPIRVGTAYFSDNSFLNKLGLNPVYTLVHSYLESNSSRNKEVNLMDDALAIKKVQEQLNIINLNLQSPIARTRNIESDSAITPNVVVIIMESMSAAKMTRHGNTNQLTPFLDSLSNHAIYFENLYSAGKHTFNGIFSTLYSFPALYRQHPLKQMLRCNGISTTLKENGYSTTYFTTHDSEFDNVGGALRANDFEYIISQSDYPMSEVKTTLGVPDDYMFRYSIPVLNDLSKENRPFFAAFMTTSDHGPYYVPDYYKPRTNEIKQQVVEYADWSLQQFISMCSEQLWFDNTIFVFLADHGVPVDAQYDIALNYFHSPLIFYAPKILKEDTVYSNMANQIDMYPTLMGILKQPYINNTLGVDLINEERKYAIINDDDKIGILDSCFLCIMKNDGTQLYRYQNGDKTDYVSQYPDVVKDMTDYAKANMQVFQHMILTEKTNLHLENKALLDIKDD